MADLTVDVAGLVVLGPYVTVPLVANAADTYYQGSVVYIDTAGGCQLSYAAGDRIAGVCLTNQGAVAAGGLVEVCVKGVIWFPVGTNLAAEDEGHYLAQDIDTASTDNITEFLSTDPGDLTIAENDMIAGQILRVTATQMLVAIEPGVTGRLIPAVATNVLL